MATDDDGGDDGFAPNLSPREIFELGSFGGTYWRPIRSAVTGRSYEGVHHASGFPTSWWHGIPEDRLSRAYADYDPGVNGYKVRVGTSLEVWEAKGWINEHDPYGWVQWYCEYVAGRRLPGEDARQMGRWTRLAGPRGRFRRSLVTLVLKKGRAWDDATVSPKIRQTLQHWGYRLTEADFEADLALRDPAVVRRYRRARATGEGDSR